MAFLERAVQRSMANSASGQPNFARSAAPGNAIGTPQPSRPAATPASPALNTGVVGRPRTPQPMAQPASYPAPPNVTASSKPAAPTPPPTAAPPTAPPAAPVSSSLSPAPLSIPRPGMGAAPTATAAAPAPPLPVPRDFKGMPSAFEMKTLQPGEQAMTPWGPAVVGEDGRPRIQFTPEGEQKYRQAVVAERKKFRLPPGFEGIVDQLPVTPGQPNFDPFSGKWTE